MRCVSLSYLSPVDVSLVDPRDDESLASNVDALSVCLLDGSLGAVHDVRNVLHLRGADLSRSELSVSCFLARVDPDDDDYDAAAGIVPIELVGGPSCRIIAGMAG